jgi:hypothetical protein
VRTGFLLRRRLCAALDQALCQAETAAQSGFFAGHPSFVGFMIVASQVKEAMENEDFELHRQRVVMRPSLARRGFDRNGEIASRRPMSIQSLGER